MTACESLIWDMARGMRDDNLFAEAGALCELAPVVVFELPAYL
jgi:hypothetical protein